jgi:DNA-binding CsgD family transcriptional regulator
MRTEISRDGQELLLHIPIHLLAEDIRRRLPSSRVDLLILTAREREVFEHLRSGKVNKEIAAGTNLSVRTVKFHLSNIYRKLRVPGRQEAIQLYG